MSRDINCQRCPETAQIAIRSSGNMKSQYRVHDAQLARAVTQNPSPDTTTGYDEGPTPRYTHGTGP